MHLFDYFFVFFKNQEGLRVLLESLVQQCEVMIKHMDFSAFSQSTELGIQV